jgi:hypothetical protein
MTTSGRCSLHANKRHPAVLLKIDIAKAFDTVAWPFLLKVLCHIGFPRRWTNWISILLSTASTKVILNGRAGQRITHDSWASTGRPAVANALRYHHGHGGT